MRNFWSNTFWIWIAYSNFILTKISQDIFLTFVNITTNVWHKFSKSRLNSLHNHEVIQLQRASVDPQKSQKDQQNFISSNTKKNAKWIPLLNSKIHNERRLTRPLAGLQILGDPLGGVSLFNSLTNSDQECQFLQNQNCLKLEKHLVKSLKFKNFNIARTIVNSICLIAGIW